MTTDGGLQRNTDRIDCVNPFNHAGCSHGGWRERRLDRTDLLAGNAAREAATYAQQDLSLDLISIKLFELGPLLAWNPGDDPALGVLNGGPFDPGMMGKAVHPTITPLPTVWVRAGLSPALTAAIVLHEARHLWQMKTATATPPSGEEEERDAEAYMWPPLLLIGFERADVVDAMEESQVYDGEEA